MSFMEHLDDLRISLIRVVTVFAVGMVAALIFYRETPVLLSLPLEWAKHPETSPLAFALSEPGPGLVNMGELKEFTFMGVWKVLMYAAFGVGVAVASPVSSTRPPASWARPSRKGKRAAWSPSAEPPSCSSSWEPPWLSTG